MPETDPQIKPEISRRPLLEEFKDIDLEIEHFSRKPNSVDDAESLLRDLEGFRVKRLGKKSVVADQKKLIGKIADERERRDFALFCQKLEEDITQRILENRRRLETFRDAARAAREAIDVTIPGRRPRPGHLHPITLMRQRIEDIFVSLGYLVEDDREIETDFYNFDALNIPADHPARDMQDTFWLDDGRLLRTHTSPVQIRALEKLGPPLRMIAPGRVFRNEEVDPSHEHTFYQLEGMMVDRDVSVAHLIYFMQTLLKSNWYRTWLM